MSNSQRRKQNQGIGYLGIQPEQGRKERTTSITVVKTTGLGTLAMTQKMQHSGFMLISVDTPYYSKPLMKDYCVWALENLNKFLLTIVDMPQMYNYWVRRDMPLEQAKNRAEQVGQERKKNLEKIIHEVGTERISVIGFNDLAQESRYEIIRDILARYLGSDTLFEQDVFVEMSKHVKTMQRGRNLANFFIDEVAASLYLSEFGNYPIEVAHQDEFAVVKNIYAGKYNSLTKELELRGNVGYIQTARS